MYHGDHAPPHFHVEYQGREAFVSIATGDIISGSLPGRAARLVKEWALERQEELLLDWNLAQRFEPLNRIKGADND
ncbi:MAG: DUF4160 domain-containing protein [Burkholderiales bacterium]